MKIQELLEAEASDAELRQRYGDFDPEDKPMLPTTQVGGAPAPTLWTTYAAIENILGRARVTDDEDAIEPGMYYVYQSDESPMFRDTEESGTGGSINVPNLESKAARDVAVAVHEAYHAYVHDRTKGQGAVHSNEKIINSLAEKWLRAHLSGPALLVALETIVGSRISYGKDHMPKSRATDTRETAISEIMAATSIPWKWTYSSERQATAEFTVGDIQYQFKAKNSEYDHVDADRDVIGYDDEEEAEEIDYRGYWEISFTGNGKTNMMGTGNAAQVISAITDIIKEFLIKYNKKIRVIEYDVQGSSGRSGVYGRIFSKLLPNWTQEDGSLHDVEVRKPMSNTTSMQENFADGRNPQDKGDSKRHGVPTKASVSTLRKVAKQGGRKGQLAHWMANMKAGKAKK
jgi:hypothetical protein